MPAPLVVAGIGAGISALSRAFKPDPNKWLHDRIKRSLDQYRQDRYVPDRAAFDANRDATIEGIMSQLPASIEAFNADAASRGLFSSGEAQRNLYSDAINPIAQSALQAGTQANVQYEQIRQRGLIAGDQYYQNLLQLSFGAPNRNAGNRIFSMLEEGGDFATQMALLTEMGLFEGGG